MSSPGRIFGPPREARSTFYNTVNNSMHYIQNLGPDDSTAPSTTCSITIDGSQLEGQHQQLTLRLTPKKPSSTSDHTSTIPQPARLTSTSSSHTPLHRHSNTTGVKPWPYPRTAQGGQILFLQRSKQQNLLHTESQPGRQHNTKHDVQHHQRS